MPDERVLRRGRVTNSHGSGLARALVYVASGTAGTPEIAVKCDDTGHFSLALPRGRFWIEARSVEGAVGSTEIDVTNDIEGIAIVIDE
jgi:hypothetical protein